MIFQYMAKTLGEDLRRDQPVDVLFSSQPSEPGILLVLMMNLVAGVEEG